MAEPAAPAPAETPKPGARRPSEMRFGAYPLFALFWPLALGGELCALLQGWRPEWAESLAWVWITMLLTCMVASGFDVRRNLAIGWILFVAVCWIGGLYLREAKDFPILGHLREALAGLDATLSTGFMHAVSILVTLGLAGVWLNVWINHRWRITHNEMHLFRRGEMEDAITRGAKRIVVEFPDVFELLLLGAGHVIVRDSKGKEEIRRIPRVPWMVFRRKQLDAIAEVWAVSGTSDAVLEDEDEG